MKSDSDDGDIRDADGYIDQVRDLIGRLDRVKGDDSRAREVVDRYPATSSGTARPARRRAA